jgi:hypothetical protein
VDILRLTQRTISLLFNKVRENILCNYIDKVSWLKATYGMQNGSFMNLSYMEEIPMNLFLVMYEIHKEAVESVGKE